MSNDFANDCLCSVVITWSFEQTQMQQLDFYGATVFYLDSAKML
jgi:hypothetical protein